MNICECSEWGVFPPSSLPVIAGPCSAESLVQVVTTAELLKNMGIGIFRAGIWKPRTHPGSFEGVGAPGLEWLREVERRLGMKSCCEVATPMHVEECARHGIDMVWIGARTTANPFLVQELAEAFEGRDMTVLVKNPVNPDLDLWIGAFERLYGKGIRKLAAIHRGVSTFQKLKYRNDPAWQMAIGLRERIPQLPVFCDPSHMSGNRNYIRELSQRALDLGFEGLMIEVHPCPKDALSDSAQQLTPDELKGLLYGPDCLKARQKDSPDNAYKDNIGQLRAKIDIVDENLVSLLAQRMDLSKEIGVFKKENNIAIMQTDRWDTVMDRMIAKGKEYGLSEDFIRGLYGEIHRESIAVQHKRDEDR